MYRKNLYLCAVNLIFSDYIWKIFASRSWLQFNYEYTYETDVLITISWPELYLLSRYTRTFLKI